MNALTTQKFRHFLYQISQSGEYMNGHHWIPLAKELLSEIDNDNQAFISILNDEHKAFAHQYPESIVWRIGDDYSSLLWAHRWEGWQARAAIALAERTSSTGSAVVSDEQLLNKPLPELLGLYWDIAYSEGKTGVSRGTEAQCVLSSILSAAAAQPAQAERQAAGAMSGIERWTPCLHDLASEPEATLRRDSEGEFVKLSDVQRILAAAQPVQEPPSQQPVAWAKRSIITKKINGVSLTRDTELKSQTLEPLYAAAQASAQADSRDSARLDWLEAQRVAYGFEDCHEGNEWQIAGPFATLRKAIDAAMSSEGGANG